MWESATPAKRLAAIENADKANTARRSATTDLARMIQTARRRQTNPSGYLPRPRQHGGIFSSPASTAYDYPVLELSEKQKAMLEQDASNDYTEALKILSANNHWFESSFPAGDVDGRRNQAVRLGMSLKKLIQEKSKIIEDVTVLSTAQFSADLYSPQSQFRELILELKKLLDQIKSCSEVTRPFTSFSEDRCWLCPKNHAVIRIPELTDAKSGFTFKVVRLSLLNKLAKAGDAGSIAKMRVLTDDGKVAARTYKGKQKVDLLQTSHLCEPAHGGDHYRCYNPTHLIPETSQENNARKNCLGKAKINGVWVNLCTHGTPDGRNRCLGSRIESFDTKLSAAQESYLPPRESRRPVEQSVSRLPSDTQAPPASAQLGRLFEW